MASLPVTIALVTSLPAFLVGSTAAMAGSGKLPTSKEIGQALISSEYERCRSGQDNNPIAQSHCATDRAFPNSITFEQFLCANYGADLEKNPIARCVFKGEKRIYPNPAGYALEEQRDGKIKATPQKNFPPEDRGDGTIDLIHINGSWLSMPEPKISFE